MESGIIRQKAAEQMDPIIQSKPIKRINANARPSMDSTNPD